MRLLRLFLLCGTFVAAVLVSACAETTTGSQGDESPVQEGEVVTPTPAATASPTLPVSTPPVSAPEQPVPPPSISPTPDPVPEIFPAPPVVTPPSAAQPSASPCPANRTELPPGTWGAPDVLLNVASQSAVVHGDLVTSAGSGLCGALLETRTQAGELKGRHYLPRGLMDYYTGIAKFPHGGFILSGMRSEAPVAPQATVIHRMVVALVDEKANLIWKNDFAPEGPSMQNWGYSVVTDRVGNSYVAANLNGFSVVKLNAKGERLWTYNYAENSGVARAIRFDADGNVVATGYVDVNLQSEFGDRDVFVIKLSPKKKIIFKHRVISPTLDHAYDLAINAAGKTWVLGWSADQGVRFGKKTLRLPAAFLICIEPNGTRSAIIDVGQGTYTARVEILPSQRILISGSSMDSPLTSALFSPDGKVRMAEKVYANNFWNILNFMVMGTQGDVYVGLGSGTPLGQAPSYAFGSIRKLSEADLIGRLNTAAP
ncbi:hypothetical protein [Turneriella parva]|uniref:Uncharacterized protein n=1 Tax=Turneriella parva (strain ATCC BAA-1111 / DSM 21527 / NCTC 11395 / H) TaxID=869212 RepID=I4B669_TURPD|nr:hypothetical protein [Turneriella parva]AFM12776.1 hypothetical protein Turpa_2130 [Turneriella parva DSM 21527]